MAGETVSIKGTRNGLVILLDADREFEDIKAHLRRKMESARGFFKGARFTVYQEHTAISSRQQKELENICRQYGLIPSPDVHWPPRTKQPAAVPRPRPGVPAGEPARLVERTLRSGQEISYDGHVVVTGDVHRGAVIRAGGNVLVMGACLGGIYAGLAGDCRALVAALHLAPVRLAIAGVEMGGDEVPPTVGPRMARVADGRIVFSALFDV